MTKAYIYMVNHRGDRGELHRARFDMLKPEPLYWLRTDECEDPYEHNIRTLDGLYWLSHNKDMVLIVNNGDFRDYHTPTDIEVRELINTRIRELNASYTG